MDGWQVDEMSESQAERRSISMNEEAEDDQEGRNGEAGDGEGRGEGGKSCTLKQASKQAHTHILSEREKSQWKHAGRLDRAAN